MSYMYFCINVLQSDSLKEIIEVLINNLEGLFLAGLKVSFNLDGLVIYLDGTWKLSNQLNMVLQINWKETCGVENVEML